MKKDKIKIAILIPLLFATFLIGIYVYVALKRNLALGDPDTWGSFGDYLGGLLNPIVGISTLYLLVKTLTAQREAIQLQTIELQEQRHELQLQRDEAKRATETMEKQNHAIQRQSMEQSLFSWLANYRDLIKVFEYQGASGALGMRQFFAEKLSLKSVVRNNANLPANSVAMAFYFAENRIKATAEEDTILRAALESTISDYVYHERHTAPGIRTQLRVLYRLIIWIDQLDGFTVADRWHYIRLVRAQLSDEELNLILYTGLTENGQRFARLAEKYALFDNIGQSDQMIALIRSQYFSERTSSLDLIEQIGEPFPYTIAAFESMVAKHNLGLGAMV